MIVSLLALAAAAAGQTAPADPLAPARAGQIQCIQPNVERKTCVAIASYKPSGETFSSTVQLLVAPQPAIVVEVTSKGRIEKGSTCVVVNTADYQNAKLTMDGDDMPEEMQAALRPQLITAIASMAGKKACSTERPDGSVLSSDVTLDGAARPDLTQKLIWVKPEDGYKLGM